MQPRRLLSAMALAALLTGTVACGGDDSDDAAEAPAEEIEETGESSTDDTEAPDTTDDTDGSASLDGIEMDVTVQFAGFSYELTEATLDETDFGNTITVQAQVRNLGDRAATPYPTTSIRLGEEEGDIEVTGDYEFSEIPGGGNGRGELSYVIEEEDLVDFDLATAQLTIGSGDEARVVVPLDGSEDDLTTRVPQVQDFTGDIVAGGITFTVEESLVRWDEVQGHSQVGSERALLQLSGRIANTGDHQICPEDGMVLTLPDGTDVVPEAFEADSGCVGGGETLRDVTVTFEIDDPEDDGFPGDYVLKLGDDDWGADRTPAQADPVTITLAETEASTGAEEGDDEDGDSTDSSDSGDEEVDVEGITDDINDALSGG